MDRISYYLEDNYKYIKQELGDISTLVVRRFYVSQSNGTKRELLLAYLDGLNDSAMINEDILAPLMSPLCLLDSKNEGFLERIIAERISIANTQKQEGLKQLSDAVLNANCILLADGCQSFYSLELRNLPARAVSEPQTDIVVRGPREGFNENIQTNISLLRRRLKAADFKSENLKIGRYSQTDIAVCYIEGIVKPPLIEELKKRLQRIDIDGILDSGYIEQLIEDAPLSVFPTVGNAEKPDIIASKLLEGKAAIIVDGSPAVLFVPKLFPESFQISEDYYNRFYFYSVIRLLRWLAYAASIVVPGLYIAITTYHQEILPSNLIMIMSAVERNTPFSSGFSMLLMIIVFEVLREVGVRLPRPLGQTIGIVGGLVMGEAAVMANIISAPVLIVMAFTVICSYVSPSLSDVSALLRFGFLFVGWLLGAFGLLLLGFIILFYMGSMRSFGVPYLSPLAPFEEDAVGDILVRKPLWAMLFRSRFLSRNHQRMKQGLMPKPSEEADRGDIDEEN